MIKHASHSSAIFILVIAALIVIATLTSYAVGREIQRNLASAEEMNTSIEGTALADPLVGTIPTPLTLDRSCMSFDISGNVIGLEPGCTNLGEAQLADSTRVRLLPTEDFSAIDVAFFAGPNELTESRLQLPTYDFDNDMFSLSIIGRSGPFIYVENRSGHESYPTHYVYGSDGWQRLDVWDAVRSTFPDTTMPPLSLQRSDVAGQFIVTEERYCCDMTYSPDRVSYRMQYLVEESPENVVLPNFSIVKEQRIAR